MGIPGIGEAIADIITRLHRTGTHPSLERMRSEIPEGVLEMLSVPGLRPDKVLKLHKQLGVTSLEELQVAARQDRIKNTKGLGPALQRKVLQGLEIRTAALGARHMHRAAELIAAAEKNLRRALPGLKRIVPAGDFRRGCELVCDLSLVAEETRLQRGPELVNAAFDGSFRLFKGIESDILPDGSLDYPDDVLRQFDFIVASIHGQFRMDREAQTDRLLRAVANPFVSILGHMTGRQLLRRAGYDGDVEKVLKACADHGIAVEINANPWRLDLDWRWHQRGLELGCIFSINPDAHSIAELDLMRWGLAMARKGGVSADRVLNARKLRDFSDWLEDRRGRIAPTRAGWRAAGHSVGRGRPSRLRARKISATRPPHAKRGRYRIRSA